MDKLRSMEVFVAVADAGSFTAAAQALQLSAVMVGKHVRQLEQQLGARLIERSTRRQSLTDVGRVFGEDCRRVLEQVRWAETAVERQRGTPTGLLRGFDLAIRIGPIGSDRLVARPLRPYRMTICAAPAYLKAHGVPRTPADLAAHRCLNHLVWNRHTSWDFAGHGTAAWPSQAPFASNNGQALREAALAGAGLLLQPEELVADDLAAGRLRPVLQTYLPAPRAVHAVYPAVRHPLPRLTQFVAHLLARMGPDAPPKTPKKKARTRAGLQA